MEEGSREAGCWNQPGEGTEESRREPTGSSNPGQGPQQGEGEAGRVQTGTHSWRPRLPSSPHSPGQTQRRSCSQDPRLGFPIPPRSGVRGQRQKVRVPVPIPRPARPGHVIFAWYPQPRLPPPMSLPSPCAPILPLAILGCQPGRATVRSLAGVI